MLQSSLVVVLPHFIDFATAFPSLAHRWPFSVIRRAGLPEGVIRVVEFLYADQITHCVASGAVVATVGLGRGSNRDAPCRDPSSLVR